MAVVPEERELTTHGAAALLEFLNQGQGSGAISKAEVAFRYNAAFHHNQRPLDQLQLALGHGVEHRVGVTGAAAESRAVCVAEGAVVVESGLLPAVGGGGPLPTQEMHAAAPLLLLDAFFHGDALQAGGF